MATSSGVKTYTRLRVRSVLAVSQSLLCQVPRIAFVMPSSTGPASFDAAESALHAARPASEQIAMQRSDIRLSIPVLLLTARRIEDGRCVAERYDFGALTRDAPTMCRSLATDPEIGSSSAEAAGRQGIYGSRQQKEPLGRC